jgi:hypothetical protein
MVSVAVKVSCESVPSSLSEPESSVPYQDVFIEEPIPARFAGLLRTPFRIAERQRRGSTPDAAPEGEMLVIFPGFGVSVSQIQVDRLLWNHSHRYDYLITHAAINYRTSHEFLLWQYSQILRRLPCRPIKMLGISLGGTTAVQLLFALRDEPALCRRFVKLVTLLSAVSEADFTPRWQNILRLIRELRGDDRPTGELTRLIRGSVLRVVARAIQKSVQRSCLEASSGSEIIASFTHFSEAYGPHARAIPLHALPRIEIVSVGLELDDMVAEARAHRYAAEHGRHIIISGEHTPTFYAHSKEQFDSLFLSELG